MDKVLLAVLAQLLNGHVRKHVPTIGVEVDSEEHGLALACLEQCLLALLPILAIDKGKEVRAAVAEILFQVPYAVRAKHPEVIQSWLKCLTIGQRGIVYLHEMLATSLHSDRATESTPCNYLGPTAEGRTPFLHPAEEVHLDVLLSVINTEDLHSLVGPLADAMIIDSLFEEQMIQMVVERVAQRMSASEQLEPEQLESEQPGMTLEYKPEAAAEIVPCLVALMGQGRAYALNMLAQLTTTLVDEGISIGRFPITVGRRAEVFQLYPIEYDWDSEPGSDPDTQGTSCRVETSQINLQYGTGAKAVAKACTDFLMELKRGLSTPAPGSFFSEQIEQLERMDRETLGIPELRSKFEQVRKDLFSALKERVDRDGLILTALGGEDSLGGGIQRPQSPRMRSSNEGGFIERGEERGGGTEFESILRVTSILRSIAPEKDDASVAMALITRNHDSEVLSHIHQLLECDAMGPFLEFYLKSEERSSRDPLLVSGGSHGREWQRQGPYRESFTARLRGCLRNYDTNKVLFAARGKWSRWWCSDFFTSAGLQMVQNALFERRQRSLNGLNAEAEEATVEDFDGLLAVVIDTLASPDQLSRCHRYQEDLRALAERQAMFKESAEGGHFSDDIYIFDFHMGEAFARGRAVLLEEQHAQEQMVANAIQGLACLGPEVFRNASLLPYMDV